MKTLKFQIQHYKEIIKQRLVEGWPVVTFQDNMQLMRTSMRHLRLSKLQKDKVKQNKMWDFTVRGFRVGDIIGLEELFRKEETAVKPQKEVKDIKSDDFLIGKYYIYISCMNGNVFSEFLHGAGLANNVK